MSLVKKILISGQRFWLIILFLSPNYNLFAQQSIQFSQYVFNGIILNPAYSGYRENTNAELQYRTQWTGIDGGPKTTTFALDGVSRNLLNGLGFEVISDHLGAQSNLQFDISYALRIKIGETSRLSFGLATGYSLLKIDGNLLTTLDPSENLSSQTANTSLPDLKFGIFYASDRYFIGFSAINLLSNAFTYNPSFYFIKPTRNYYLIMGGLYPLSRNLTLKPSLLLKEDFNSSVNMDFNLFFLFAEKFWIGGSYRTGLNFTNPNNSGTQNTQITDNYSVMTEFYLNSRFRLGYSYDFTSSAAQSIVGGTHEISLGVQIGNWYHHHLQNPRLF